MGRELLFNQHVEFQDPAHEAVMGVWWSGILLKKQARRLFQEYLSSEAQFNIMLLLKYAPGPLSQHDLSEKLLVDKSNVTGLVKRMTSAGLIDRSVDPDDQRACRLTLTPAGAAILERLEGPYREKLRQLIRGFSEEERRNLVDYMLRLQQAIIAADEEDGASENCKNPES